jgi:hypothetical protein
MKYIDWFKKHAIKHEKIMQKLHAQGLSDAQILDYFEYENISQKEVDFCPLYKEQKKCHDMQYLNCFLCACPHFRFDDEALHVKGNIVVKSMCAIDSKFKESFVVNNELHLDCSKCKIPHTKAFVKKQIEKSWVENMPKCTKSVPFL